MNYSFQDPQLSAEEIAALSAEAPKRERELAKPGRYAMTVKRISARQMGSTGKFKAEIFLVHADAENRGLTGASLVLFRAKDSTVKNSSVTQRFLKVLGQSAGINDETALHTMTWAPDTSAEADEYGSVPAAIGINVGGNYEALNLEGVTVLADVDVETFTRRDGSDGEKNIIKRISTVQ